MASGRPRSRGEQAPHQNRQARLKREANTAPRGRAALGRRGGIRLIASGAVTIDVGLGRRVRPLGPISWDISAPPETVFDLIASPYLGRTPRALAAKLNVWERSANMVLAAHFTDVKGKTTTTLETVAFERPNRIQFRLVR